jgi:hypothetical protein
MYLMIMDENGDIDTRFMPIKVEAEDGAYKEIYTLEEIAGAVTKFVEGYNARNANVNGFKQLAYTVNATLGEDADAEAKANNIALADGNVVFVDYYVKADTGVKQIDIEADKFGGSYYLEASTLFRDQGTGEDHPAEFIIPNCKVQSNFTFTMAPSGDPSTFTFTMDAFPDYTKFDKTKKVLAALQIVEDKAGFGALTAKA